MSRDTFATATENLVYSNLLITSALKNLTWHKKSKWYCFTCSFVLYRAQIVRANISDFSDDWWQKKIISLNYTWNLNFHSVIHIYSSVIYSLCRKHILLNFNKFHFSLCYNCDELLWEEGRMNQQNLKGNHGNKEIKILHFSWMYNE